jgi:Flp pilus assembly protein TadD
MNRNDDAIESLERAVELAPRDEYYRLRLGAALMRAERTEAAVSHFEAVAQMQPTNASYQTLLLYAYMRNDQQPEIAVEVEKIELGAYDEDFVNRIQRFC